MKLFSRYNRISIIVTLSVLVMVSLSFLGLTRYIIFQQVDDDLRIEKAEIEAFVAANQRLPQPVNFNDQQTLYRPLNKPFSKGEERFKTIEEPDMEEHDTEVFREFSFALYAGDQWWLATVRKSLEGTEHLVQAITLIMLGAVSITLLVNWLVSRMILQKLWQPFYRTIEQVKTYRLDKGKSIYFENVAIDEFQVLNKTLSTSLSQSVNDFNALKQFTENASHELQTPLAILRSKLELLMQDAGVNKRQSEAIHESFAAIKRLTRLNQSLLLLAKIGNRQFAETETVNLSGKLENKLEELGELITEKEIQLRQDLQPCSLEINTMLLDILLNNLVSNAIRHNFPGGEICIKTRPTVMHIENTGNADAIPPGNLFVRFAKPAEASRGYGLGLSIVKEICDASGLTIVYSFQQPNRHAFTVSWN